MTARVYPRACGGTPRLSGLRRDVLGLSPRVRGNLVHAGFAPSDYRSIPARAGEPRWRAPASARRWVYPRACGGTDRSARSTQGVTGLSPRVRGNPEPVNTKSANRRSIPARAGEPNGRWWTSLMWRVYPRACGGTFAAMVITAAVWGLSPRVRGNPTMREILRSRWRSIPARAGEPASRY